MKRAVSVILTTCALGCAPGDQGELQQPVPVEEPSPIEYPLALWDRGVQGETEIMIHVTDMGEVDSVLVSRSSGIAEFDSAALTGARRLRFSPGRRGDSRIAMWTRIPVRFTRDSVASLGAPIETSGN